MMAALATLAPWPAFAGSTGFVFTRERIIVQAHLNGQGPYSMIVDSGAEAGAISRTLADALGLAPAGAVTTQYGNSYPVSVATLSLGPDITLPNLSMILIDPARDLGDAAIDGLVPASLLTGVSSLLDFNALTITRDANLQVPEGFAPISSSLSLPDSPRAARPYSTLAIGPNQLRVQWDTGAPLTMQVPRAAAVALGLWDDAKPYAPERFGHIGGPDARVSRIIRAGPIDLGPVSYDSALILLSGGTAEDASFGLGLIATLNLFTDVPARTLYIQRNAQPVPEIGYDLSGLSLTAGQGELLVADVGTGSPAAAAGIRRGDLVLQPATMDAAQALLDARAGTNVTFTVLREAGPQLISFTLTAYL